MTSTGRHVDISVLVVTLRAAPDLITCLDAIRASIDEAGVVGEVILVANGRRATRSVSRLGIPEVSVVAARVNRGFAGGLRLARRRATGSYLVVVQDDAVLEPPWIRLVRKAFDKDPALGAASGTATTPAGEVSREGWVFDGRWMRGIDWGSLPPELMARSPRRVEAISSSSMMVRADAWDAVGGPDPRLFPLSHVDFDLSLRLLTCGWSIGVAPEVTAVHAHGTSLVGYRRGYALWRNDRWWRRRWAAQLEALGRSTPSHAERTQQQPASLTEFGAIRAATTPHPLAATTTPDFGHVFPEVGWRGDAIALMRLARFRTGAVAYRAGQGLKTTLRPSVGPTVRRLRQRDVRDDKRRKDPAERCDRAQT